MDFCLKDYIGILVCADDTPSDSGLYINSLPGISLESIDKIANADQKTYLGVWADIQQTAYIKFKTDFITQLTKCFEITRKCDYESLLCDNIETLANAWMYLLGNQMMVFRLYTTRLNRFTTVAAEQAAELRDYYAAEYVAALTQAAQLIDMSECTCMEQGGQISRTTWLP